MCDKRNSVELLIDGRVLRLDPCIRSKILNLNQECVTTVGSCCGHNFYRETILYLTTDAKVMELNTGTLIPRIRNFYRMDSRGLYYIPEISRPKGTS